VLSEGQNIKRKSGPSRQRSGRRCDARSSLLRLERLTGSFAIVALLRVVLIAAKVAMNDEDEAPRRFLAPWS
jgi:hypothetical protein